MKEKCFAFSLKILPQSQVDKMNYFVFEFMEETMGEYYLRKLLPLQSSLTVESNKRDYYRLLYLIMMDITNAVSEIHKKDFVHR
jgi:serine/threonine protein kinase